MPEIFHNEFLSPQSIGGFFYSTFDPRQVTGGILKKGENLFGKIKGNKFTLNLKIRFVAGYTAVSLNKVIHMLLHTS
jgi:hypothetical protein